MDFSNHVLHLRHNVPPYRHLYAAIPGQGSMYSFSIVTWPGHLTVTGDLGTTLMAAQSDDLLARFDRPGAVSYNYWAGKAAGAGIGNVYDYRAERVLDWINDRRREEPDEDLWPAMAAEVELIDWEADPDDVTDALANVDTGNLAPGARSLGPAIIDAVDVGRGISPHFARLCDAIAWAAAAYRLHP